MVEAVTGAGATVMAGAETAGVVMATAVVATVVAATVTVAAETAAAATVMAAAATAMVAGATAEAPVEASWVEKSCKSTGAGNCLCNLRIGPSRRFFWHRRIYNFPTPPCFRLGRRIFDYLTCPDRSSSEWGTC